MVRMLCLAALLTIGAAQLQYSGETEFDKISSFLSALDVNAEEDAQRMLTLSYTYVDPTALPAPSPTSVPMPSPTAMPTSSPTAVHTIEGTLSLSGMTCTEFTPLEEKAVKMAIAATVSGVETSDIGNMTCADGTRRRKLLTSTSVVLGYTITVTTSAADTNSSGSYIHQNIESSLTAAVSNGAFVDEIVSAATTLGVATTSVFHATATAVVLTAVTATHVTDPPTPVPVPAPTAVPVPAPTAPTPSTGTTAAPVAPSTPATAPVPTASPVVATATVTAAAGVVKPALGLIGCAGAVALSALLF